MVSISLTLQAKGALSSLAMKAWRASCALTWTATFWDWTHSKLYPCLTTCTKRWVAWRRSSKRCHTTLTTSKSDRQSSTSTLTRWFRSCKRIGLSRKKLQTWTGPNVYQAARILANAKVRWLSPNSAPFLLQITPSFKSKTHNSWTPCCRHLQWQMVTPMRLHYLLSVT